MITRIYFYLTLTFYGTGNQGEAVEWTRRSARLRSANQQPLEHSGRLPGCLLSWSLGTLIAHSFGDRQELL